MIEFEKHFRDDVWNARIGIVSICISIPEKAFCDVHNGGEFYWYSSWDECSDRGTAASLEQAQLDSMASLAKDMEEREKESAEIASAARKWLADNSRKEGR